MQGIPVNTYVGAMHTYGGLALAYGDICKYNAHKCAHMLVPTHAQAQACRLHCDHDSFETKPKTKKKCKLVV